MDRLLLVAGIAIAMLHSGLAWAQPGSADSARLRRHLLVLTNTPASRDYRHPIVLDSVAAYIIWQLKSAGARAVHEQTYQTQVAA